MNYLVTGASSGIGKSVVHQLDKENNHLYLIGRNESNLLDGLVLTKSKFTFILCDLEKTEKICEALSVLPSQIDGFVHCAGVDSTLPLNKISIQKFEQIFKLNFFSFIEIMKVISKLKKSSDDFWTSVVAVSSIASKYGGIGQTLYSSSKAALESSVRVLSKELIKKKIRINCVSPGLVNTEMTRRWMNKLGIEDINELNQSQISGIAQPENISSVIIFLLSKEAAHIIGHNLVVDGGGPTSKFF